MSLSFRSLRALKGALCALMILAATPLGAAIITVNSTSDAAAVADGLCTLREAITAANTDTASGGAVGECVGGDAVIDTIAFNIPGVGVHTISPATVLPDVTTPVAIDGYSQSGSSVNSLTDGTNAVILIALDGGPAVSYGLQIIGAGAAGTSVRGLRVGGFANNGIILDSTTQITVAGNCIGTDGAANLGNGNTGVFLLNGVTQSTVGGPNPADRNLIAGNAVQVSIGSITTSGNFVRNNLLGTDAGGNALLAGSDAGVYINQGQNNEISDNVIGGVNEGVRIFNLGADGNLVTANRIGVGTAGGDLGGNFDGVIISDSAQGAPLNNIIGGSAPGFGNVIANWNRDGVRVARFNLANPFPTGNAITRNSMFNNAVLGINLVDAATGTGFGVDANDAGDVDGGSNNLQNFPVLNGAVWDGSALTIDVTFESVVGPNYVLDFYHSPSCDGSGFGEGTTHIGVLSFQLSNGTFNIPNSQVSGSTVISNGFITATATRSSGDTSEFSACVAVQDLTGGAGTPASLTIFGGKNQSTAVNTVFPQHLRVLVEDGLGDPVAGVTVFFDPPPSGAGAALTPGTTVVTNAQGIAEVTATANAIVGSYQVRAGVQNSSLPSVVFDLTNTLPEGVVEVPALGTWGLLALGAGLAAAGTRRLRAGTKKK